MLFKHFRQFITLAVQHTYFLVVQNACPLLLHASTNLFLAISIFRGKGSPPKRDNFTAVELTTWNFRKRLHFTQ